MGCREPFLLRPSPGVGQSCSGFSGIREASAFSFSVHEKQGRSSTQGAGGSLINPTNIFWAAEMQRRWQCVPNTGGALPRWVREFIDASSLVCAQLCVWVCFHNSSLDSACHVSPSPSLAIYINIYVYIYFFAG